MGDRSGVVVAVVTFKRPEALARCLESLGAQTDVGSVWGRQVIVVDNDPDGSAESTATRTAESLDLHLTYQVEAEPGISAARNCCIRLASSYEFLAFLDDDEQAEPTWLSALIQAQKDTQADIVGGPVLATFEVEPPAWVEQSGVFERSTNPTIPLARAMGTGNVLLRLAIEEALGTLFDPRYGLTGGSDTHLFERAKQHGFTLAWCPDAVAHETISPERIRPMWVVRRGYRVGVTQARISLELGASSHRSLVSVGLRRVRQRIRSVVACIVRRQLGAALGQVQHLMIAWGLVIGALGGSYTEYSRK